VIALRDLQDVAEGKTPVSILALIQLGYATFPPPSLTDKGAALLEQLQQEQGDSLDSKLGRNAR
jgi:hypothetical protein